MQYLSCVLKRSFATWDNYFGHNLKNIIQKLFERNLTDFLHLLLRPCSLMLNVYPVYPRSISIDSLLKEKHPTHAVSVSHRRLGTIGYVPVRNEITARNTNATFMRTLQQMSFLASRMLLHCF